MAIYQIVKVGDNILREKAKPVPKINSSIIKLLDNMKDTMDDALGVGLAAPQVGVSKRVIVIDIGEGLIEFINPEITSSEGIKKEVEGCLSVPGVKGEVSRAERVIVTGLNRNGDQIEIKAEGLLARALQHEIDHLEGVLFIDIANNIEEID
ncbi:MAG: peptide deformylase [Desulfitibacter sp. BRH_c19]|nr:MAG: peptide deformylase [Desulfitibacter sp. BRH_c19]